MRRKLETDGMIIEFNDWDPERSMLSHVYIDTQGGIRGVCVLFHFVLLFASLYILFYNLHFVVYDKNIL